jgi:organic radical activating enzyme
MACGCPVITCHTSSIPEVAGEAVIYIDPFNANELAIALETVQNPSIRENLRSQGFAQVQRFSWAKMADIVAETITQTAKEMSHSALRREDLLWSEFRKAQQEKNALYQQYQSLEQEKNVFYQQQQSLIQRYQSLEQQHQSLGQEKDKEVDK